MPLRRRRVLVGMTVPLALALCGCSETLSPPSPSPTTSQATINTGHPFTPNEYPVAGTIRAVRPPADQVAEFAPIMRSAEQLACPGANPDKTGLANIGGKTYVVVACPGLGRRTVKVHYTRETVPDLIGNDAHGLSDVAVMLNLHIAITHRPRRPGEQPNQVVAQDPAGGSIVPPGSTVSVTVAR